LRREGLFSSLISSWRAARDRGELAGLTPKKRGRKPSRNPLASEVERLNRQVARLEQDLEKARSTSSRRSSAWSPPARPWPSRERPSTATRRRRGRRHLGQLRRGRCRPSGAAT